MLQGMLLARSSKKIAAKVKAAALAESQLEAEKLTAQGKRDEAVRSLLGPRGGLPALKADLVKLCHLLHLEVKPDDTVDTMKGKIKPMLAILKVEPSGKVKSVTEAKAKAVSPPAAKSSSAIVSPPVTMGEVNDLLGQQQERFQGMLSQTLQHVMAMGAGQIPSGHIPAQGSQPSSTRPPTMPMFPGGWSSQVAQALIADEGLEPPQEERDQTMT